MRSLFWEKYSNTKRRVEERNEELFDSFTFVAFKTSPTTTSDFENWWSGYVAKIFHKPVAEGSLLAFEKNWQDEWEEPTQTELQLDPCDDPLIRYVRVAPLIAWGLTGEDGDTAESNRRSLTIEAAGKISLWIQGRRMPASKRTESKSAFSLSIRGCLRRGDWAKPFFRYSSGHRDQSEGPC